MHSDDFLDDLIDLFTPFLAPNECVVEAPVGLTRDPERPCFQQGVERPKDDAVGINVDASEITERYIPHDICTLAPLLRRVVRLGEFTTSTTG
jgi:hypothetical protein